MIWSVQLGLFPFWHRKGGLSFGSPCKSDFWVNFSKKVTIFGILCPQSEDPLFRVSNFTGRNNQTPWQFLPRGVAGKAEGKSLLEMVYGFGIFWISFFWTFGFLGFFWILDFWDCIEIFVIFWDFPRGKSPRKVRNEIRILGFCLRLFEILGPFFGFQRFPWDLWELWDFYLILLDFWYFFWFLGFCLGLLLFTGFLSGFLGVLGFYEIFQIFGIFWIFRIFWFSRDSRDFLWTFKDFWDIRDFI